METFQIFSLQHRGTDCIGIRLEYGDKRNLQVKQIPGVKWSQTHKCWYGAKNEETENRLKTIFHPWKFNLAEVEPSDSHPIEPKIVFKPDEATAAELEKFKSHLRVKRYAPNTIKNYEKAVLSFLQYLNGRSWQTLEEHDFRQFQQDRIINKNLSGSYQNILINAIKLFYKVNKGKAIPVEYLCRPRRNKELPKVIAQEDIKVLLNGVKNQKHRMMLCLLYSCGLRSGELINLQIEDIDSKRGFVIVRMAKGNKDRLVPLSPQILVMLREYYKIYKPMRWLFEGQRKGEQYSHRSLQSVFRAALKKARLDSRLTMHCLRHSYATHLLEAGTNLRIIQDILGHKSSRTTEIYTHVSNAILKKIKSPFDDLNL